MGPISVAEKGGDAMERGQKNKLQVNLVDELAELYKVTVRQDGSKLNDDWYLDRIELSQVDLATGRVSSDPPSIFIFKKWIKARKLYDQGKDGNNPQEYKIRIQTADVKHAGTDDTVYIEIVGAKDRIIIINISCVDFSDACNIISRISFSHIVNHVIRAERRNASWTTRFVTTLKRAKWTSSKSRALTWVI